jgi:hypothetical protein
MNHRNSEKLGQLPGRLLYHVDLSRVELDNHVASRSWKAYIRSDCWPRRAAEYDVHFRAQSGHGAMAKHFPAECDTDPCIVRQELSA